MITSYNLEIIKPPPHNVRLKLPVQYLPPYFKGQKISFKSFKHDDVLDDPNDNYEIYEIDEVFHEIKSLYGEENEIYITMSMIVWLKESV